MLTKFIFRVLLFTLLASALYLSILTISGYLLPAFVNKNLKFKMGLTGFMNSRLKDADHISDSIDILFIGSSHAYRGFDTRFFAQQGFSSFNLGSSNQTPKQSELLLKHYLKNIKPRLIVFEVYPETFEMDGIESSVDIISNSSDNKLAIQEAYNQNNIISWNTLFYRLIHNLFSPQFKEDTLTETDRYISGQGYVETLSPDSVMPVLTKTKTWKFRQDQLESFKNIVQLLHNSGVKYILVQAPTTKGYFESYLNNKEVDNTFSDFGPYYNFNLQKCDLVDTLDFHDVDHLNQNGVIKFNSALLHTIQTQK